MNSRTSVPVLLRILAKIPLLIAIALLISAIARHASADSGKVLNFALSNEPPELNSMKSTDQQSIFVLGHVIEGLTAYGKKEGEVVPGVAEKWEIGEKEATFHLRHNALWSDGKPVTAGDFVFAWRKALDPQTASEYAFILYPVQNAEKINTGKAQGTDLGVAAVDDYTLKVTFEKPCAYFIGLTAMPTYAPVREDFFKAHAARYGADADEMLYNGPFVLSKWVHSASLEMVKNPNYWDAKRIKLDRIEVPYITADTNAQFAFFKDKKVDLLERLSASDLEKATGEHMRINSFPDGSVWYMEFNFRPGRLTANHNLRKAIAAVFNPGEFVSKVVRIPKTKPAVGIIPSWLKGVKTTFRAEYKLPLLKPDYAAAKQYMAAAMKELNLTAPPSIVWLTQDTELAGREAEYFQNLFKTVLGINLKIDRQIFKERLAKMSSGDFDIVSAGWGPDYADPMTFADLKTSWNENNRGKWANDQYDDLIRKAQATVDPKTRMDAMAAAEKIMIDDVAVLPTYERTQVFLNSDRVTGIERHAIGPDPYFVWASVK